MQMCFELVTYEYTFLFFNPPSQNTLVWESRDGHLIIHSIFASHCCDCDSWYFGSLGSQGRNAFTKGCNSVSTELGVDTAGWPYLACAVGLMPVGLKLVWSRHGISWWIVSLSNRVSEEFQGGLYQFVIIVYCNSDIDVTYTWRLLLYPLNTTKK